MKRLLLLLVPAVAFALGAATAAKLNTFPYVPAELNAPCGKSVFEWNVMAGHVDTEPIPLNADFDIIRLEGEPKPQGLIVRAYLRPRDPKLVQSAAGAPAKSPQWQNLVSKLPWKCKGLVRKQFGLDVDAGNVFLLVHINDRLVAAERAGKQVILGSSATREEQLAALATIMSHAPPPAP